MPKRVAYLCACIAMMGFTRSIPPFGVYRTPSEPAELVYSILFNDSAPYGTDEDSDGTADCTTHGATATDAATYDCQCATCDAPEGDGAMQLTGDGTGDSATQWFSKWDDSSDIWITALLYIDTAAGGETLFDFRRAAVQVGGGYVISVGSIFDKQFGIICDGVVSTDLTAMWSQSTWEPFLLHVDFDAGDIEIWRNDYAGSPDVACTDGVGGEDAAPGNGFLVNWGNDAVDLRLDELRFYDSDPR